MESDSVYELDGQIQSLEQKNLELKDKRNQLARLNRFQRTAVSFHKAFCTHNHTDGCGWEYESNNSVHDWKADAHRHWLTKATLFIETMPALRFRADDDPEIDKEVSVRITLVKKVTR
jgi:hypothetical protein